MELRQLRYFVALAEELHFGKAAARLDIAQPALTQQIKALERAVGATLFNRTKRSVALSTAGQLMLEEARQLLRHADRTRAIAVQAGRGELGIVEIGFVGSATFSGVLASAILSFRQTRPQVDLRLYEMGIAQQLIQLDERKLDVGFVRPPVRNCPAGVVIETVTTEDIILAINEHHPFATRDPLYVRDLKDELFIVPSLQPGTGFFAHSEAVWNAAGFTPRVSQRATQLSTICSLVAAGLGVALLPGSLRRVMMANVVYRTLADVTQRSPMAVAFRRNELSPAVKAFIADIRATTQNAAPGETPGQGR